MVLNEVDKEMESVIPKTDCRLRPDIRAMENGEIGEESALGAGLLVPFILVSVSIIAVLRVLASFMLKSSNFGFEFENLSSALLRLKLIAWKVFQMESTVLRVASEDLATLNYSLQSSLCLSKCSLWVS